MATDVSPSVGLASTTDVHRTPGGRPVSIADRLSHLNDAQGSWKAKVQDKDSKQFTVEGKMGHCKLSVSSIRQNLQKDFVILRLSSIDSTCKWI